MLIKHAECPAIRFSFYRNVSKINGFKVLTLSLSRSYGLKLHLRLRLTAVRSTFRESCQATFTQRAIHVESPPDRHATASG